VPDYTDRLLTHYNQVVVTCAEPSMTLTEHFTHLGGLIGNFQSLEFLLRVYLYKNHKEQSTGLPYGIDFNVLPIGNELPESYLTNFDSLAVLIKKFNFLAQQHGSHTIDLSLVDVRDALAHGRVSTTTEAPMRLLKFSKPRAGKVALTFSALMTDDWFRLRKKEVAAACNIIVELLERSNTA
jgi:hypothetical protein